MKNWIAVIFLLGVMNQFHAQQLTQFTYFTYNYLQYNPAVAGTAPCLDLKFGVRKQWKGFPGSPTTAFANLHGKIGKEKKFRFHGLGATVENDDSGPFSYTAVNLVYAYHIRLANKYYLSAGLGIGFNQYRIDYAEMILENQSAETAIFGSVNDFVFPAITAGLWLYKSDRFYGLSVRNLNSPKIDGTTDTRLTRHWTFANGYAMRISEELTFKPAFLLNYAGKSRSSIDAQFLLDFKDMIAIGIAARSGHGFSALMKLSMLKYVTIAYSYDITVNKIRYGGASTHELILGIRACTKANPLHVPCAAYD